MSQQTDTILFLSTPSARRATGRKAFLNPLPQHFYPRPPRGGRRPLTCAFDISSQFLSTPSARRATFCCSTPNRCIRHFYPRPPRGGRQLHVVRELTNLKISIHALREEGDNKGFFKNIILIISIHALREEGDHRGWMECSGPPISIHALREEGDSAHLRASSSSSDFYPRPPRGGRPGAGHPARIQPISIHALREEGDGQNTNNYSQVR